MRLYFWLIALIAGTLFLAMLTGDFGLTIGERAQGGYAARTAEEQVEAEARAAASRAEANDAANEAMKALDALNASGNKAADTKE
ncbi:hypothetical protein [Shinella sp.]|uniref:hypothetical protein n=1 Tax=Shinella sp. TaxID=1870904 RepID=UPI0028A0A920|nr:hypothetical protein [Shinella sp.]